MAVNLPLSLTPELEEYLKKIWTLPKDSNLNPDTIGKAGAVLLGILGITLAFTSNNSIADTTELKDDIASQNTFQANAGTNDALMSTWSTWSPLANVTAKDIRGSNFGLLAVNTLGGTASGASAGWQVGGPIGAVVGGVAGLASGIAGIFTGNAKARRTARRLNRQIDGANNRSLDSLINQAENIEKNQFNLMEQNSYAYGGDLFVNGASWNSPLNIIGAGGTHEENPNGGVQLGIAPDGQPNVVEEGEVIYKDKVLSNRLKLPKTLQEKYKLKEGLSFAEASKKITSALEDRPNDPITNDTVESIINEFYDAQEELKLKRDMSKAKKLYDSLLPNELEALFQLLLGLSLELYAKGGCMKHRYDFGSTLLYAPVLASGVDAIGSLFRKPNQNFYESSKRYVNSIPTVGPTPIGNKISEHIFDKNYQLNQLSAENAALRNSYMNTSGGNRANLLAGLLAADYNAGLLRANLAKTAESLQLDERNKVAAHNASIDLFNALQALNAAILNQLRASNVANMMSNLNNAEHAEWLRNKQDREAAISNFSDNLFELSRDLDNRRMTDALGNSGVYGVLNLLILDALKKR